jgi:hypothetical protein
VTRAARKGKLQRFRSTSVMDTELMSKPGRGGRACPRGDGEVLQWGRRGIVTWLWFITCCGHVYSACPTIQLERRTTQAETLGWSRQGGETVHPHCICVPNICCLLLRQFAGAATNGPSMQLYNDGIDQGASVTAKYIGWGSLERPNTQAFDGTWVIN